MIPIRLGEPLFADVAIKNEDIGFIQGGQPVQVKQTAYMFQKYDLPSSKVETLATNTAGQPDSLSISTPSGTNQQTIENYTLAGGIKTLRSSTVVDSLEDANGTSRIETVTTYTHGVPSTVRNVYDNDGTLHSSTPVTPSAAFNLTNQSAAEALNALNAFLGAVRSGQPVPLLTSGFNLAYSLGGHPPNLQGANTVISGLGSVYGLHTAFQAGGSDLARAQATLSSINYFNNTFFTSTNAAGQPLTDAAGQILFNNTTSTGLNSILNGVPGVGVADAAGKLGLINGGIPGALPVLGLVLAIKSGDPIGILGGLIGVFNPGLLTAGPLGWILAGASILKALTATTPKAWGVVSVSYGAGINNLAIQVNATGETFGTQKARQTEQILIDGLEGQIKAANKSIKDSLLATGAAGTVSSSGSTVGGAISAISADIANIIGSTSIEDSQLGLIAQRLPTLTWRASDLNDSGFKIVDIDPLTGQERLPFRRFDDDFVPFSSNPAAYTVDPTDPEQRGGLLDAMMRSALTRGAIAPLWEVQTAKLQGDAGEQYATHSIAAYAIFNWAAGLNGTQFQASNDGSWRMVA